MNYLTLGSILLGATAGLSGAGYFATTYFKSDKENAKEIFDKRNLCEGMFFLTEILIFVIF